MISGTQFESTLNLLRVNRDSLDSVRLIKVRLEMWYACGKLIMLS